MRGTLSLFASITLVACATTTEAPELDRGGGGKEDGGLSGGACPIEDGNPDDVIAAIDGAGRCAVAIGIAEACGEARSLDVQYVASATAVCSRGFSEMTSDFNASYQQLLGRCLAKYSDSEGTMYRSFEAYCQLEVTWLANLMYPEPETSEPVVEYETACSVRLRQPENIENQIRDSGSCASAANLFEECSYGSSADLQFAAAVAEACASEVTPRSALDEALYNKLLATCDARYQTSQGTMFDSMRAQCRVQVEAVLSTLYAEVD